MCFIWSDVECECNNHGLSCIYNDTLGYGVCTSCQHNTKGSQCEACSPKYYRNVNVPLQDLNTCIGKISWQIDFNYKN